MRKLSLMLLVGAYAALLSACAVVPSFDSSQAAAPATPSVADGSGAVWDCNGGCRRIR